MSTLISLFDELRKVFQRISDLSLFIIWKREEEGGLWRALRTKKRYMQIRLRRIGVLNANKNVVMVFPLQKRTPLTASSNRDENTHASHSATEVVFFFSFPIRMALYNGISFFFFLHPSPAAHEWLNVKEVMYFKAIIKGVKSWKYFSCRGFLTRHCEQC